VRKKAVEGTEKSLKNDEEQTAEAR